MSESESFAYTGRITGSKSHRTSNDVEFRMLTVEGVGEDAGSKRLIKIWPKKKDSNDDQPWLALVGEAVFDGTVPVVFKGYSTPKDDKPDERWYVATKVEAVAGDTNPTIERARAAAAEPPQQQQAPPVEEPPQESASASDWGAPGNHGEHTDHHLREELERARDASAPRQMPPDPTELRLGDREFEIVKKLVDGAARRERTAEGLAVLEVLMSFMPRELIDGDDVEARVKWLDERAPGLLRFARSISRKADEGSVTA